MEIGHEIISTAILPLPLIQVGQLSAVHFILVNRLGSLPRKCVVRLTDSLDKTIVVDWETTNQTDKSVQKLYKNDITFETTFIHP